MELITFTFHVSSAFNSENRYEAHQHVFKHMQRIERAVVFRV